MLAQVIPLNSDIMGHWYTCLSEHSPWQKSELNWMTVSEDLYWGSAMCQVMGQAFLYPQTHSFQNRSTINGFWVPHWCTNSASLSLFFFPCLIALVECYHVLSMLKPRFTLPQEILFLILTSPWFSFVCDIPSGTGLKLFLCRSRPILGHCQAVNSTIIPDILNQGPTNTQKTGVRSNSQGVALARPGQELENPSRMGSRGQQTLWLTLIKHIFQALGLSTGSQSGILLGDFCNV